jgi:hypothetical protein
LYGREFLSKIPSKDRPANTMRFAGFRRAFNSQRPGMFEPLSNESRPLGFM